MNENEVYIDGPFSKPWEDSDYVLIVEDRKLYVHSCILAMASPVFKTMFNSNWKESIDKEVVMTTRQYDVVESMLKAIYPQVECDLSEKDIDHLRGLIDLSNEYLMETVNKIVEKQVMRLCHLMVEERVSLVEKHRGYVVDYRTFSRPDEAMKLLSLADHGKFEDAMKICLQHVGEKYFFQEKRCTPCRTDDTIKELCDEYLSEKCKMKLIGEIMMKNLRFRNEQHNKDLQKIAEHLKNL